MVRVIVDFKLFFKKFLRKRLDYLLREFGVTWENGDFYVHQKICPQKWLSTLSCIYIHFFFELGHVRIITPTNLIIGGCAGARNIKRIFLHANHDDNEIQFSSCMSVFTPIITTMNYDKLFFRQVCF